MLHDKTIILAISSSIAAYKSCEIVSQLKKLGAEVWVVMTREATNLVTPLTFRTLSGNPVICDLFSPELSKIPVPHISLTKKADLLLIAPCTANIIGKIASGIADDALTTMVLASSCQKLIAPAMNPLMWNNVVVGDNVKRLKKLNFEFIGPEEGKLACGDEDIGRMSEPEAIVSKAASLLVAKQDLAGKHILVTAGGTREAIDPVRYISNRSSGRMGYSLATAARERGASVTLISGPTNLSAPLDIKPIIVESAGGMLEAVMDYYNNANAVIMAAAVADYTTRKVQSTNQSKIKKSNKNLELVLRPTQDILATLSKQKGRKGRVLVGFALETHDLIENAKKKLKAKDLDLVVANDPKTFDSDAIKFSIIDKKGKISAFPQLAKSQAAHMILDRVSAYVR
ncbi:MAG: bifunctional phosphopantothenoylcysteine decarboxylase/phosphopantothenate--cysteine ligase CoaBC [Candidatus Saganbacteria bacterium]|nr:bifunctional phosphopantothenoylcysteine decarboxylase/phosphopantothenate--cysteine ligase CoaBC [Candidatus Saganbacteria bacterium]